MGSFKYSNKKKKHVYEHYYKFIYSFLLQEAFDYIGSSRVVFDMQKGVFPIKLLNGIKEQPALINLNHISTFIELSQLSPAKISDSLWLHTDPVSTKTEDVYKEVMKI